MSCATVSPIAARTTDSNSLSARAARAKSSSGLTPRRRPASVASCTISRAPGNQSHHVSITGRETRSNFGRTGPSSRPRRVTRAIASVERTSKHDSIASGPSWRAHGSTALDATSPSSSRRSSGSPAAAGSPAGCLAETSMDMSCGSGGGSIPSSNADGPTGGRQASPSGDGMRSASAKTAALSSNSKAAAAASAVGTRVCVFVGAHRGEAVREDGGGGPVAERSAPGGERGGPERCGRGCWLGDAVRLYAARLMYNLCKDGQRGRRVRNGERREREEADGVRPGAPVGGEAHAGEELARAVGLAAAVEEPDGHRQLQRVLGPGHEEGDGDEQLQRERPVLRVQRALERAERGGALEGGDRLGHRQDRAFPRKVGAQVRAAVPQVPHVHVAAGVTQHGVGLSGQLERALRRRHRLWNGEHLLERHAERGAGAQDAAHPIERAAAARHRGVEAEHVHERLRRRGFSAGAEDALEIRNRRIHFLAVCPCLSYISHGSAPLGPRRGLGLLAPQPKPRAPRAFLAGWHRQRVALDLRCLACHTRLEGGGHSTQFLIQERCL
mmetsp:Transcript_2379/g.7396  ORF Transcript_2379/g.7396 Transcript_2379/m.7396 type:complete len:557 (-) Transcript_2379:177-1847(-)